MKNTTIVLSAALIAAAISCTNSAPRRPTGTTGAAGTVAPSGTAGTTAAAAGTNGAAGDGSAQGTAGTAAAGTTGGTAGTAAAGTTGAAGDGSAGTAAAGTTGAAGDGSAGTAAAGTNGAAGTTPVACTPGPLTGATGGTGNACASSMWTITPSATCDGTKAACGFCSQGGQMLCAPKNAIDGSLTTRFTDGQTQIGNENIVLTFAAPVSVTGVKLDSSGSPTDATTSYLIEYSLDGTTFNTWCPPVAGPGGGAITDITFPARIAVKALRINQTGAVADLHSWWSIQEITLDGCQMP